MHAAPAAMSNEITVILEALARGERHASEDLLPLVYAELRKVAVARMARESAQQTLQPTALVHEAWLELVGSGDRNWQNRAHFFGAAAHAMRRILIQKARRKSRLKHGGGQVRLNIADNEIKEATPDEKILLIDDAVKALEGVDPKQGRIVELKFFGGLTTQEAAQALGLSERTVEREWACAKAWLFQWIRSHE
jgi:RNA polymerase sigma factor (TIGR02999 family)